MNRWVSLKISEIPEYKSISCFTRARSVFCLCFQLENCSVAEVPPSEAIENTIRPALQVRLTPPTNSTYGSIYTLFSAAVNPIKLDEYL